MACFQHYVFNEVFDILLFYFFNNKMLLSSQVKEYLKLEYERNGKPRDDPFYEKIMADIFRKSDQDRDGLISAKEYNIYEHDEL